jgi:hypothetical protein
MRDRLYDRSKKHRPEGLVPYARGSAKSSSQLRVGWKSGMDPCCILHKQTLAFYLRESDGQQMAMR